MKKLKLIAVSERNYQRLMNIGKMNETFDQVIDRILNDTELIRINLNNDVEIEIEIQNFEDQWQQGPTAYKDAQISAKRIFKMLKINHGSLTSNKEIINEMKKRLGHLNGITDSEIKKLIGDNLIDQRLGPLSK